MSVTEEKTHMIGHRLGGMVWMWPMMIVGVVVAAGIVVLLVLVIIRLGRSDSVRQPGVANNQSPRGASNGGSSARSILDERYARGEIDDDEYRRRRETLS
jgi:putative membrane protein